MARMDKICGIGNGMFETESIKKLSERMEKDEYIYFFIEGLVGKWIFCPSKSETGSFAGFMSRFSIHPFIGTPNADPRIKEIFNRNIQILDDLSKESTEKNRNDMKKLRGEIRDLVESGFGNLNLGDHAVTMPESRYASAIPGIIAIVDLKTLPGEDGLIPFPSESGMIRSIQVSSREIPKLINQLAAINEFLISKGVYSDSSLEKLVIQETDVLKFFEQLTSSWMSSEKVIEPPVKYLPIQNLQGYDSNQRRYLERWNTRRIHEQAIQAIAYILYYATKRKVAMTASEAYKWLEAGGWDQEFSKSLDRTRK
jgi:hypothetical protein